MIASITKEEFEEGYAIRSGITVEKLRELGLTVLPCQCEDERCKGWQMVTQEHAKLLDPATGELL